MPPSVPASGILQLQDIFQRILNLSVGLALVAMTVVVTYSGFVYLTSAGEPAKIKTAGQAITWALLGVLFLVIGWLILKLIELFTGVTLTQFCLGFPGAPTNCP